MSRPAHLREHSTWIERAVDSVFDMFSKKRANLRRHWRSMERDPVYRDAVMLGLRARGYRTANSDDSSAGWSGSHGHPDIDLLDLPTLRSRSREATRDDAIAAGLAKTRELNVIGPELRPQAQTGDKAKNDALELVWAERKDQLDPVNGLCQGAAQRLRLRKLDEDGEIFVVRAVDDAGRLFFEIVEGDRVWSAPQSLSAANGWWVHAGVEKDVNGRPRFYHVHDVAQGAGIRALLPMTREFRRVPVDQCRHVKNVMRPGQTRGVPANHAILNDLRDLDLLLVASMKRTQIAACLAAFLESSDQTGDMFDATAETYGYKLEQSIEPGMIFKLYPGEKITPFVPSFPFPEIEPLIVMVARRIGAARGISWQSVLSDWSQSNYSSARTQLLSDRISYTVDRQQLVDELFNWEWQQVMEHELLMGHPALVEAGVTVEDIPLVQWIAAGWQWVDPEKEGRAVQLKLEIGLTCLRDEAAAVGKDWEDLLRQRLLEEQREKELREELGLTAPAAEPEADGEGDEPEDMDEADERSFALAFREVA